MLQSPQGYNGGKVVLDACYLSRRCDGDFTLNLATVVTMRSTRVSLAVYP